MVCIPKTEISADVLHVFADKVRPLCIFSVFYRVLLSSCWARRASTRAWLANSAPEGQVRWLQTGR